MQSWIVHRDDDGRRAIFWMVHFKAWLHIYYKKKQ
jgi:hypothetical protein